MTVKDVVDVDDWLLEPDTANTITSTDSLYPPPSIGKAGHRASQLIDEESGRQSRRTALIGLIFAAVFGLLCLVCGIVAATHKAYDDEVVGILPIVNNYKHPEIVTELVRLAFTKLNTIATESLGYVHAVTQRSTVTATTPIQNFYTAARKNHDLGVQRSALQFHTNLRLFSAPRVPLFHPNGTACNFFMGLFLILSYASVSLSVLDVTMIRQSEGEIVVVAIIGAPLVVLGVCILLKCCIVTIGFYQTEVLTWSASPLNNTYAAITAGKVARIEGLCMYSVVDSLRAEEAAPAPGTMPPPRRPSTIQPSSWQARSGVRRTIIALWTLVTACGAWGAIIVAVWANTSLKETTPGLRSWSFFPNSRSNGVTVPLVFTPVLNWFVCFFILILVQGSLTMALHCCELIVNVLRDEDIWRKATTKTGTEAAEVLKSFTSFWPSILLLVGKTILHWIFGFCLSLQGSLIGEGCTLGLRKAGSRCASILALPIVMRSVQIWYLTIALILFSACMTFLATRKPKGPQPAAYGHMQTLANLIDDWNPSMKMWWGHKEVEVFEKNGEYVYHAGTDDSPLPSVKSNALYS